MTNRAGRDHRYNTSEKGRARHERYNHSDKGHERWLRYSRKRLGWFEPGGMATDEEMEQFRDNAIPL